MVGISKICLILGLSFLVVACSGIGNAANPIVQNQSVTPSAQPSPSPSPSPSPTPTPTPTPIPPPVPQPLDADIDLTGYTLTFHDEFNSLSVATQSPKGTATWYYWPPYGAAGAYSASQWDAASLSVQNGVLFNKLFMDASGGWHSGNISSVDESGNGFSQQYGYFEARIQMPDSGNGSWPAFWINAVKGIPNVGGSQFNEEIDIFEWYGVSHDDTMGVVQQASHNWNSDGSQSETDPFLYQPQTFMPNSVQPWKDFHIYGCKVDPQHITWYIDGVQTNQIATPTKYVNGPLYIMIDYAIGGGWPLSGLVENSTMKVDWVRVYSLP